MKEGEASMSQFEKLQKAAALKYSDLSSNGAPVVVASGLGVVAQQIVDIAGQSGVPVFRDDSLATLLSQLHAGTEIPPELYQAVVDIYVYFLGYSVDAQGNAVRSPRTAENTRTAEDLPATQEK
jgi:flagellar biosynthesis protein